MNDQPKMQSPETTETLTVTRGASVGRTISFFIILLLAIVLTAYITFSFTVRTFCHETDDLSVRFQTIDKLLDSSAYYDPQYDQMKEAALKAYVGMAGDKYTRYYTEEEYATITRENEGHYVGIGVTTTETVIEYLGKEITVLEVVRISPESSANEHGLLVGDYIYAVRVDDNIQYVDDVGRDVAVDLVRGEAGTKISLLWLSKKETGYVLNEAALLRKEIVSVSVEYSLSETDPSVGIVRLRQFDLIAPVQLCRAMDDLKAQNVNRIVLDLRDNGGGDLLSVIACASYFLEQGDAIITAENKDGARETHKAVARNFSGSYATCSVEKTDIGKYRDCKVVVLVNEKTASAAELLTAVFRDYDLATIVGMKTYGKGSMQNLIALAPFGLEGGIKITTSLYYPPGGEGYNGIGIMPDVVVELDEGVDIHNAEESLDNQLVCAIKELTK